MKSFLIWVYNEGERGKSAVNGNGNICMYEYSFFFFVIILSYAFLLTLAFCSVSPAIHSTIVVFVSLFFCRQYRCKAEGKDAVQSPWFACVCVLCWYARQTDTRQRNNSVWTQMRAEGKMWRAERIRSFLFDGAVVRRGLFPHLSVPHRRP